MDAIEVIHHEGKSGPGSGNRKASPELYRARVSAKQDVNLHGFWTETTSLKPEHKLCMPNPESYEHEVAKGKPCKDMCQNQRLQEALHIC